MVLRKTFHQSVRTAARAVLPVHREKFNVKVAGNELQVAKGLCQTHLNVFKMLIVGRITSIFCKYASCKQQQI